MSYFQALDLQKEPFSTSPSPDFFYQSKEHKPILFKAQIMLELRRGLGVIFGDIGVGKTTLLRILYQITSNSAAYCPHIILDPTAKSEYAFLKKVGDAFGVNPGFRSTTNYRNAIEHYLFQKGLEEKKIVVLFVDEAQKLSEPALEVLRILLNYETHDEKLIQLVLLGQLELLPLVSRVQYFWDRIALKYIVKPLEGAEIKEMIEFRLKAAGYPADRPALFTDEAVQAIYTHTQGYPRKVIMICHDALEYLVMNGRPIVDRNVVADLVQQDALLSKMARTMSSG